MCHLVFTWTSLVAQLVKHLPAMRETWVPSLGWEDLPEKGMATHSSILAWKVPWIKYDTTGSTFETETESWRRENRLMAAVGRALGQGWNPGLPHGRQMLYQLSHKGSPRTRGVLL